MTKIDIENGKLHLEDEIEIIYEKIVSRKIGDLYDLARNPGIVK